MIRRWMACIAAKLREWLPSKSIPGYEGIAKFHLTASPLQIPPEAPEGIAALLRQQRARFEPGELFSELAKAAATGATVEALISETGLGTRVHKLCVMPRLRRK